MTLTTSPKEPKNMSDEKLKACPFCGTAAEVVDRERRIRFVECPQCRIEQCGDTLEEAITAWNSRQPTPTAEKADVVEAVARTMAAAEGLNYDEVCGYETDAEECDSSTCIAAHYEDHDADFARGLYDRLARAAIAALQSRSAEPAGEEPDASSRCPVCGLDEPHQHSALEAMELRGRRFPITNEEWLRYAGRTVDPALINELDMLHKKAVRLATPSNPDRLVGWRTIDGAPKDGTWIITAGGGADFGMPMKWNDRIGAWECDACMLEDWDDQAEGYSRPTHWMPLPAAPTLDGEKGE